MMRAAYDNPHDDRITKTCRKCGLEKSISQFPFHKPANAYISACHDCENERKRRYGCRRRKKGTANPWTDRDRDTLRRMHDAGARPEDVAAATGRSIDAVKAQRWVIGLPPWKHPYKARVTLDWTPDQLEVLRDLLAQGLSLTAAGVRMGICRNAAERGIAILKESRQNEHLPDMRQSGAADRDQGLPGQQCADPSRRGHQVHAPAD